jgi:hypothetical protein
MHLEFLVEEPSAEAALRNLVPKILGENVSFAIHPHQGKRDLLKKLPGRLRGYRLWLPSDYCIVVLIDNDCGDCTALKETVENHATCAGLRTKSRTNTGRAFQVLTRLAMEELEAWFLGDAEALHAAYPRLSWNLAKQARFRYPDAIRGGTWEALERLLQKAGYYRGGMPKIEVARNVSERMKPEYNRSRSFSVFRDGLLNIPQRGDSPNPSPESPGFPRL